ncbi:MAG: class I SAM-dependent methyltransferase [Thermoleophilia bacterium]|nr:class I SAM-dependent methyltransferase [Thermoleophilia bacterium]
MSSWDERADAYRESDEHREGRDLDLLLAACGACAGLSVLDVATGGGHVARRLRDRGAAVVTVDASPGMNPDVVARAEELPFADASFDLVVTRIAAHHFTDVGAAVAEMARVTRDLVLIEDTLYLSDAVEEAEQLRDVTHVRNYREGEWREFLEAAGLDVEAVDYVEKEHPFADWLARTGCEGAVADRVRELLAGRTLVGGEAWSDVKLLLKARKPVA